MELRLPDSAGLCGPGDTSVHVAWASLNFLNIHVHMHDAAVTWSLIAVVAGSLGNHVPLWSIHHSRTCSCMYTRNVVLLSFCTGLGSHKKPFYGSLVLQETVVRKTCFLFRLQAPFQWKIDVRNLLQESHAAVGGICPRRLPRAGGNASKHGNGNARSDHPSVAASFPVQHAHHSHDTVSCHWQTEWKKEREDTLLILPVFKWILE